MSEEKFVLSWEKINVKIVQKIGNFFKRNYQKTILDDGSAESGSLVAIMGPSGSGKTTFLSAISGRSRDKTGIIRLNNIIISDENLRNKSGYAYQKDICKENLTVLEHLTFISKFKLKSQFSATILKILLDLALEPEKNTQIRHLSGGQKRRLSLAGELICNPLILFCDEPTTGLDSYNAVTVVQKLQDVAASGKLVIVAIHQPSSQLFHYFDHIMLLAEGKLVFQGTREDASSFFESLNLICPQNYNPADFYINCLNKERIPQLCQKFAKLPIRNDSLSEKQEINSDAWKPKINFFQELRWLLWRNFLDMSRKKIIYLGGYLCVMLEFIFVVEIFSNVAIKDKHSVQDIEGILYFTASEVVFTNMYAVITVFPQELDVYLREKDMYSVSSYFISKIIVLIPLCLFSTATITSILFIWLKFLTTFYLWSLMTYLLFLIAVTSCALGLAFSATFTSEVHIEMIMGPLEIILMLFSGFFLKVDTTLAAISWVKYLSPFYYSFSSLSNVFWQDINLVNCAEDEITNCYKNGKEVLQSYGLAGAYNVINVNIICLHIMLVIFCLVGFAGILRKKIFFSI